jgi:hypothetical protein
MRIPSIFASSLIETIAAFPQGWKAPKTCRFRRGRQVGFLGEGTF